MDMIIYSFVVIALNSPMGQFDGLKAMFYKNITYNHKSTLFVNKEERESYIISRNLHISRSNLPDST